MNRAAPIALFAATTAIVLTACTEREPAPAPSPSPTEVPEQVPTTAATNSIFDAEAGVESAAPVLKPVSETISFAKGGSALDERAQAAIDALVASPQARLDGRITLRGHSDAGGSDAINVRISRERAEAVRDYLVANGIDEARIRVVAFGSQNPVEPNALPDGSPNETGREANRRVEIAIALPAEAREEPEPGGN